MQDHNSVSSGKKPQENPLKEKTTYRFGNRSFVVESVFKEESPDTRKGVFVNYTPAEIAG